MYVHFKIVVIITFFQEQEGEEESLEEDEEDMEMDFNEIFPTVSEQPPQEECECEVLASGEQHWNFKVFLHDLLSSLDMNFY